MTIQVLDPTIGPATATTKSVERPASLEGKVVGFISNGKEGTAGFFRHLDRQLREHFRVADVIHLCKSNYSAPAESTLIDMARAWDLAITGLGD